MTGFVGSMALGSIAGKAGNAVRAIPPRAWLWIALAVALFVGFLVHQHKVKALAAERYTTGFKAGYDAAREDTRKAQSEREKIGDIIAKKLRSQNDETLRAIDRLGSSLRVLGPGKASAHCAPVSPGASGYKPPNRPADASGPGVSEPDRAAVPWVWLVDRAEQCDINRAEALAWRSWHKQLTEQYEKSQPDKH